MDNLKKIYSLLCEELTDEKYNLGQQELLSEAIDNIKTIIKIENEIQK